MKDKDLAYIYNEYSLTTKVNVQFTMPKAFFRGTIVDLIRKINSYIDIYGFCSYEYVIVDDEDTDE